VLVDGRIDGEVRVGIEAQHLLRRTDLVFAERRPVRLGRVDGVRRRVGDVRAQDDDRGALRLGLRRVERRVDRLEVLRVVQMLDVPALRLEARTAVLGERDGRRPVDRDVVVVVHVDELPEPVVPRERRGLVRDAFHQVAVRADRVDAVIDDVVVRPVELLVEEPFRDRHPDAVCEPLAERAGRRLDPGREEVLRMARRKRLPLAEPLQLLERQVVAREMKRRVLEDAGVPCGEHEPVAVRPLGVRGVVPEVLRVDRVGERREGHRCARMAGTRLLHRVHRQDADRVDRAFADLGVGHVTPRYRSACRSLAERYASCLVTRGA